MRDISAQELKDLFLRGTPLIDVRAPIEFAQGTLPGAVNLPLLDDEQRAAVGTVYKKKGSEEAVKLGHELVSGDVKASRLRGWGVFVDRHPEAVFFCFRGGLRSQISRRWLAERGLERPLIEGGYKRARRFLRDAIDRISARRTMWILSGPTGSAKTEILKAASGFHPAVDLEALARHRGSAFGATSSAQPTQIDFENALAVQLLALSEASAGQAVLVEDESRLIGRCAIPESFFLRMRSSDLLYVEEPFERRVENIFEDYILKSPIGTGALAVAADQFNRYRQAVRTISKKLGGVRTQQVLQDLDRAETCFLKDPLDLEPNKAWIAKLLTFYYDPFYAQSLEKRSPPIVARGNAAAILDFLRRF